MFEVREISCKRTGVVLFATSTTDNFMNLYFRLYIIVISISGSLVVVVSLSLLWLQPPIPSFRAIRPLSPRQYKHHQSILKTPKIASGIAKTNLLMTTTTTTTTSSNDIDDSSPPIVLDTTNMDMISRQDAYAYHHYASMAVDLSHGHLISSSSSSLPTMETGTHIFTVQRSVRDIDENRRRKYLYTIPFTTVTIDATTTTTNTDTAVDSTSLKSSLESSTTVNTTTTTTTNIWETPFPIPPQELMTNILLRLPSPSGKYIAIFRNEDTNKDKDTIVLEIWDNYGMALRHRIEMNSSIPGHRRRRRHGKILCDPNGAFGIPSWNMAETCIVYVAEQTLPTTQSFFDIATFTSTTPTTTTTTVNQDGIRRTIGQQHVMGIGKIENYGEKYSQHIMYHSIFCVNIHTGQIGTVSNVPTTNVDCIPTTTNPITLGQVQFCPSYFNNESNAVEESIVYTGWGSHSNTNSDSTTNTYTKRLGFIYCQQRPCQLYHSKVTHLLHQLSIMEDDHDNDEDDNPIHTAHENITATTTTMEKTPCDPPYVVLTSDMQLSHSPRIYTPNEKFSSVKDGESPIPTLNAEAMYLVFLTSRHGFDTHSGCFALGKLKLSHIFDLYTLKKSASSPTIVVDEVWVPMIMETNYSSTGDERDSDGTVAGLCFPGFFLQQLPQSCFISSEYLLTTTQWGSCQKVVRVSILTGAVHLISIHNVHPYSSDEVLCCSRIGAVISTKTPNQPATVHFVALDQLLSVDRTTPSDKTDHGKALNVSSAVLGTFAPMASSKVTLSGQQRKKVFPLLSKNFTFDIRVVPVTTNMDGVNCHHQIQSILLLPSKDQQSSHDATSSETLPPLVVVPHGGPNSASITNFVHSYAYLCGYGGYAILLVNYRGSTGYGQASIKSLPTNIGTQDVQDVITATNNICNSGLVDANRIGICGGSHGGFLTAHLTGQYPSMFKAAVMRNPVVNIPSMVTSTDIPDWCYVEACGTYNFKTYRPPTLDELQTLYNVSPIKFIHKVQTPTLIALGLKDLRVPPSQGMEWYYALRGRSSQPQPPPAAKLLSYENDDHAIDGVASEADHWIHIKQWFDQYITKFDESKNSEN